MRAVVQRVAEASVTVGDDEPSPKGSIGPGLLVYLGVAQDDGTGDADWL
ncbi:MAG: D-aminoacyl-tRNA deacylase, partial [Treponema sp.]|nr:D-aminoacyl-tRNA deacylase [Treponema sp.]